MDGRGRIGNLWGGGLDLSLFRGGRPALLLGGVEGGLVTRGARPSGAHGPPAWATSCFPLAGSRSRPKALSPDRSAGLPWDSARHSPGTRPRQQTFGWGRASRLGGTALAANDPPDSAEVRPSDLGRAGVPDDRATVISGVVQTALDVMGMPYRWGDEGEEGFDCSGLIRYAFGKQGISLPRRSADQAREGGRSRRISRPSGGRHPHFRPSAVGGSPRRPLSRQREVHPQRPAGCPDQRAEPGRHFGPVVVSAAGSGRGGSSR